MAHFIMHNKMHPVVITDMMDQFIVSSTMGGLLDRVAYPALREEIIKEIRLIGQKALIKTVVTLEISRVIAVLSFLKEDIGWTKSVDKNA